jgi:hypothetical protein
MSSTLAITNFRKLGGKYKSEGQGCGIPCSILVSVVPVFSDSCSGRSGGFVPVVPVVSFRLFRVLVHAVFHGPSIWTKTN